MSFGSKYEVSKWGQFAVGGTASVSAAIITHPIDLLKVRQMVHKGKNVRLTSTISGLMAENGLQAFYSGLSASILRQVTYSTTRFGTYGIIKNSMAKGDNYFPLWKKFLSGMLAGAAGAVVGNPAEVVMVRMQANKKTTPTYKYKNVFHGVACIVRQEGVTSLWKGVGPSAARAIIVTASQLGVYDHMKFVLVQQLKLLQDNFFAHFLASMSAGLFAAITTNPVDVVKTRLMNESTLGSNDPKHLYRGMLDCAYKIAKTEGLGAFYKGFIPNLTRIGPHTIITFLLYEQYLKAYHYMSTIRRRRISVA
ncbi:mitochondrial substrate carrier family protein ucpB-like [Schistocerca gregaria]|uniref:mitochondrial substrate carrier family protein ucpB-like n=1 Tax=Schistocerca gregaria TaxID=7010 RepID=UPI00211ED98C|nr:mitochondrial substrate carrier family protein ucpB-like [Schistocerca gregaria]